jgi:hypothetical protein
VADLQKTSLKRTEQLWFPPEDLHINPDEGNYAVVKGRHALARAEG